MHGSFKPCAAQSQEAAPPRDLGALTARNQLRFLRTEIAVARSSLRNVLRRNVRSGPGVAERQITIAEEAYTAAAKFLGVARIDESVRVQLRRDLAEIRRAIQDIR